MTDWIQENECRGDKKLNSYMYRDKPRNDERWEDKAAEIQKASETFQMWYMYTTQDEAWLPSGEVWSRSNEGH